MPYIPRAVLNELWSDANCNILGDKSFADDLNLERGIVNSREALLPRAIEIQPLFSDLFDSPRCGPNPPLSSSPNNPKPITQIPPLYPIPLYPLFFHCLQDASGEWNALRGRGGETPFGASLPRGYHHLLSRSRSRSRVLFGP